MSSPNTNWSYLPKNVQVSTIPDAMFPTDNEWGIPCLKSEYCGDFVDVPVECWGAKKRSLLHPGMIHFYTDDTRFTGLWGEAEDRAKKNKTSFVYVCCSYFFILFFLIPPLIFPLLLAIRELTDAMERKKRK